MAEKQGCPKCGASSPAEGHETIPHLLVVRCKGCGDSTVMREEKASKKKDKLGEE